MLSGLVDPHRDTGTLCVLLGLSDCLFDLVVDLAFDLGFERLIGLGSRLSIRRFSRLVGLGGLPVGQQGRLDG